MQCLPDFKTEGEFAGFMFHARKWDLFSARTVSKIKCEVCREETPEGKTFVCEECDAIYCLQCIVYEAVCSQDNIIYTFCGMDCLSHFVDAAERHCLLFCEICVQFKKERAMCIECKYSNK